MEFSYIEKIGNGLFKMKKHDKMNVDALIVGTQRIVDSLRKDKTLWQLKNVASLPGIVKNAVLMPDAHEGYGFPIGGVAAFDANDGIVSPGGIGYDINCGVRLLLTPLSKEELMDKRNEIVEELFKNIPTGVGEEGKLRLSVDELEEVVSSGIDWAIEKGYAWKEDKERIEEYGRMKADASKVSSRAKQRGKGQLGTLGAGNHFLEVQVIEKIFDERAGAFGLEKGKVVVMIHTGSRGFGHQIASDYVREFMPIARKLNLYMPDPELVYLPLKHEKAQDYLKAMASAVNFAFVNRQMITYWARESFSRVFGSSVGDEMHLVYDVAHNIAKIEEHEVNGKKRKLIVHRKGATRAFPAGREELPSLYRHVGQPVLIPGSMGTASYVLVGMHKGLNVSFGTTWHGAGRVMSRRAAIRSFRGEVLVKQLKEKGILVKPKTWRVAAEEAPQAYKDVDEVAKSVELAGISRIVARLKPLAVIKG